MSKQKLEAIADEIPILERIVIEMVLLIMIKILLVMDSISKNIPQNMKVPSEELPIPTKDNPKQKNLLFLSWIIR